MKPTRCIYLAQAHSSSPIGSFLVGISFLDDAYVLIYTQSLGFGFSGYCLFWQSCPLLPNVTGQIVMI